MSLNEYNITEFLKEYIAYKNSNNIVVTEFYAYINDKNMGNSFLPLTNIDNIQLSFGEIKENIYMILYDPEAIYEKDKFKISDSNNLRICINEKYKIDIFILEECKNSYLSFGLEDFQGNFIHKNIFLFKRCTFEEINIIGPVANKGNFSFDCSLTFNACMIKKIDSIKNKKFNNNLTFENTIFTESVNFDEKVFNNDVQFEDCIFIKDISFDKSIFNGNISFINCVFKNNISFKETRFEKEVYFLNCAFNETDFSNAIFKDNVYFDYSKFNQKVIFNGAYFEKEVNFQNFAFNETDFSNVVFQDNVYFNNSEFKQKIILDGAYFKKIVNLKNCIFNETDFSNVVFQDNVYFNNSEFKQKIILDGIHFEKAVNFFNIKLKDIFNFSSCFFKEPGSVNFAELKINTDFTALEKHIVQDTAETTSKRAESLRKFFVIIKHSFFQRSNLIEAQKYKIAEFYAEELRLKYVREIKDKDRQDSGFLKATIDYLQLLFYRHTSNHHSDLLKSFHTMLLLIALFAVFNYLIVSIFNHYYLGVCMFDMQTYSAIINNFIATNKDCLIFINLTIIVVFFLSFIGFLCLKNIMNKAVVIASYICSFLLLAISPKSIISITNLFSGNQHILDPLSALSGIYTILFILLIYSLQKTSRRNSIM